MIWELVRREKKIQNCKEFLWHIIPDIFRVVVHFSVVNWICQEQNKFCVVHAFLVAHSHVAVDDGDAQMAWKICLNEQVVWMLWEECREKVSEVGILKMSKR